MLKAVFLVFSCSDFFYDNFFREGSFLTRFECDDGSAMCFASGPIFGNKKSIHWMTLFNVCDTVLWSMVDLSGKKRWEVSSVDTCMCRNVQTVNYVLWEMRNRADTTDPLILQIHQIHPMS